MKHLFEIYHPEELVQTTRYINTPSDFAKKALFYVQETGYLKSLKSHLSKRSNLPSYLFLVVLSGSGSFTYQGQSYLLKQHDCVLVDCMDYYTHQSDEANPWELLWVHFNGNAASDYYQYFSKTNTHVFHPEQSEKYIRLLRRLMDMTKNKETFWELAASCLIAELLMDCITARQMNVQGPVEAITRKLDTIKDYLDQHYKEKLHLDDIAGSFYISKFHLSREYKRIFGMTIVDYITIKRINHAKEMIRFTDLSIETIAAASGFPDASYFNKVFRKTESMTASEYRKKWRGLSPSL